MHIESLYIHPIKGLLPLSVSSSALTPMGFAHDRTFMLQRVDVSPLQKTTCHISAIPALCLFSQSLLPSPSSPTSLTISHLPTNKFLTIPLPPPLDSSEVVDVDMHASPTPAHHLSPAYDAFFSNLLGIPVRLVYLGANTRTILGNVSRPGSDKIGFADCAPLLITSAASMASVASRMPAGFDGDIRRFRANVVLAPDDEREVEAWEEDYWSVLKFGEGITVELTANCTRCTSLNVDFDTGKTVPSDMQVLKALMEDRRVDAGSKYKPIFGRYGVVRYGLEAGEAQLSVGMKVQVVQRSENRSTLFWPGLSDGTRVSTK